MTRNYLVGVVPKITFESRNKLWLHKILDSWLSIPNKMAFLIWMLHLKPKNNKHGQP